MTTQAVPSPEWRLRRHRLRLIAGRKKTKRRETYFSSDSELEFLGPHDLIDCDWAPGMDDVIFMSEPDLGYEEDPEQEAAHAAWLKDYCEKHRSKDA